MTKKSWILAPVEDPDTGDLLITFPEDLLAEAGWKIGDELVWTDLKDGSYQLTKKQPLEESTPEEDEAWKDLENKLKGK